MHSLNNHITKTRSKIIEAETHTFQTITSPNAKQNNRSIYMHKKLTRDGVKGQWYERVRYAGEAKRQVGQRCIDVEAFGLERQAR